MITVKDFIGLYSDDDCPLIEIYDADEGLGKGIYGACCDELERYYDYEVISIDKPRLNITHCPSTSYKVDYEIGLRYIQCLNVVWLPS